MTDADRDASIHGVRAWVCGVFVGVNVFIAIYLYYSGKRRLAFQALVIPLLYWPLYGGGAWGTYMLLVAVVDPKPGSGFAFAFFPIAFVMIFLAAWMAQQVLRRIPWPPAEGPVSGG